MRGVPLRGLRVVDLADELGGTAGADLAALGADVVRVEPPAGDPMRRLPPFLGDVVGPERSLPFAFHNAGKRSLVLDLESAGGRELLARLEATAAVVLFAGQAERFDRLGLDSLSAARPDLVVAALTPFGLSGPYRDWTGGEAVAWAMGGAASMVGDADRPPVVPGGGLAVAFASRLLLTGVLGALRRRGRGQARAGARVEVSLQEAIVALTAESGLPTFLDDLIPRTRLGSRRVSGGPFGNFPSADGFVSVIAAQAPHWDALAAWIAEETGHREALDPGLRGTLADRFPAHDLVDVFTADLAAKHGSRELFLEGQRRGVTVAPVNDLAGVLADPQLAARGFWRELEVDGEVIRAPSRPFPLGPPAGGPPGRAPRLGEHTAELLAELGGPGSGSRLQLGQEA